MSTALPRRPGPTTRSSVEEWRDGQRQQHEDRLAVEEPLEMRLSSPGLPAQRLGVTMRTPGHDFELVAGWILHEGIAGREAIRGVRYCTDSDLAPEQEFNVVTAELASPPLRLPIPRLIDSACGVCGADSVRDVLADRGRPEPVEIDAAVVRALPERLQAAQPGFARTGGLHGAGLFQLDGTAAVVREDIGRHNAVDKVVGARLLAAAPVPPLLVLSGRIGFELVQKAVVAGISVIVAVGAPTSLAVRLATEAGIAVIGFTRPARFVVYAGIGRVQD